MAEKVTEEETDVVEETLDVEPTPEDIFGADESDEPTEEEPVEDIKLTKEEGPTASDAPEKDVSTTEKEPEEGEVKTEEAVKPAEETAPTTVPYVVKYGGQEFTLQVSPQEAAVLDAQNKSALQFPHLQGKYQDLKEQNAKAAEMAATPKPGDAPQDHFAPEEFTKRMQPAVDNAVERGAISKEFQEMYPMEAANYAWASMQLTAIQEALEPITVRYAEDAQDRVRGQVRAEIHGGMAQIAADNPDLYGDLSNPQSREEFFQHLVELNVDVDQLRRDPTGTLAKMWGSFQGPKLIEAARLAQANAAANQAEKRIVSGGGGGGGGGRKVTTEDPLADIHDLFKN